MHLCVKDIYILTLFIEVSVSRRVRGHAFVCQGYIYFTFFVQYLDYGTVSTAWFFFVGLFFFHFIF
jgi:hypothetical protein